MLFQMSFLRGFLQSHFIKQKAWSEWLQVAFVIGTCTRSPSEASWWNEILNTGGGEHSETLLNNLFTVGFRLWIHRSLHIWIFNQLPTARSAREGRRLLTVGPTAGDGRDAQLPGTLPENQTGTRETAKRKSSTPLNERWPGCLSVHLQYTAFVSRFTFIHCRATVGHSKLFHALIPLFLL